MEDHKTCPFKGVADPPLIVFENADLSDEDIKAICNRVKGAGTGACGGEHCALWDKTGRCCTFASITLSLRQLIAVLNEQKGGEPRNGDSTGTRT